jgi:uncharacterized protein
VGNSTPSSLTINVGFLVNQPIGFSRDIHFSPENLTIPPDLDLQNFSGTLRLGHTPQGVLAFGEFNGHLELECVRCLNTFWLSLKTSFKEMYSFKNQNIVEPSLVIPGDRNIDFAPLLREYLLLEVPINPICEPECKGLCAVCGVDLNETNCEHLDTNIV